jgi:hypothetical protein
MEEKQIGFNPKHGLYIPKEAWHSNISRTAKILYAIMNCLESFDLDGCWASREYYAGSIGCSKQRVTQLIKELVDANLIFRNGYRSNETGRTQLLKRTSLEEYHRGSNNRGSNSILLDGGSNSRGGNNLLLDRSNNKLLPNIISKNIKRDNPLTSFLGDFKGWVSKDINSRFTFLNNLATNKNIPIDKNPDIPSSFIKALQKIPTKQNKDPDAPENPQLAYIRFITNIQTKMFQNSPGYYNYLKDIDLVKQAIQSVITIHKLVSIDGFEFKTQIRPAIEWALNDKFWKKQVRSISALRSNKNKNGIYKFQQIWNQWIELDEHTSKMGRLGKKSDFIDHGWFDPTNKFNPNDPENINPDDYVPTYRVRSGSI